MEDDNTQSWMDFGLRPYDQGGLGLQRHQVAGILGNLVRESGAGLPSWGPTGDNGTAWGTAQWREDRLKGLQNFAAQNGMDYRSPEAQQAWMRQELSTTHAGAFDALKRAETPEQAASAFNHLYEISADNTGGREASARAIMNGDNPLAAINAAAGIRPSRGPALAFAGTPDDSSDGSTPALSHLFPGNGQKDSRFSLGALFGASPDTQNQMHSFGAKLVQAAAALSSGVNPAQSGHLAELAKSLQTDNQPENQYMMGGNGQLVRINKRTGQIDSISIPGATDKESFTPLINPDTKEVYGAFSHTTGKPTYFNGNGSGPPNMPVVGGDPNLTGQARYDSLTPDEKKTIDAWEAGTGIQPTGLALRNPKVAKLVDAANAIGIDMARYGGRQSMARELTKSGPSAAGGQLDSSAAMAKHVTDLADDYIKLRDLGQSEGWGATAINAAKNTMTPAGSKRDQLLKSIATHSINFSGEVTKQLAGAPGGEAERERRVNLVNQPNAAPATQASALAAELNDAIAKRQATLDRVRDTMGEAYMAKNKRFADQEKQIELAKQKLLELTNGPAIKDQPALPKGVTSIQVIQP